MQYAEKVMTVLAALVNCQIIHTNRSACLGGFLRESIKVPISTMTVDILALKSVNFKFTYG